jgi:hypothetical protein
MGKNTDNWKYKNKIMMSFIDITKAHDDVTMWCRVLLVKVKKK